MFQDNSTSLLQFLVAQYINIYDTNSVTDRAQLPVPEPSDTNQAALINFDDIEQELMRIKASVEGIKLLLFSCTFLSCNRHESVRLAINVASFFKKRVCIMRLIYVQFFE